MKYFLLIFLLIYCSDHFNAQNRIVSGGQAIPKKFRKNNSEGLEELISKDSLILKGKDKKAFYISNNYFLDNLYNSGTVIFNHNITDYLNNIADELLVDYPAENKKIDVYLVKSSVPNAYTTLDGSVFINTGLIARLSSKDELAFVIAHEIGHFLYGHNIQKFVNQKGNIKSQKKSDRGNVLKTTLASLYFSREKELEADLKGLELFENSNYSWKALSPLFLVLKQADLPVFNCDLTPAFMESENLDIVDSVYLDGHNPRDVNYPDKQDIEFSTHPAADFRVKLMLERALKKRDKLCIDSVFNKIVSTCIFETMSLYNENYDFFSGMYYARYLLQSEPDNEVVNYEMVRALYGISKFRTNGLRDYFKPSINHRYNKFFYNNYDFLRKETRPIDVCAIAIEWSRRYIENYEFRGEEVKAVMLDLINDYESLKASSEHRLVSFELKSTDEKIEDQIIFKESEEIISKSISIIPKKMVIANPVYSTNLKKALNDPVYFLNSILERKLFIKFLKDNFLTGGISLMDCKTMDSTSVEEFNDAIMLTKFYEESLIKNVISSFVSRYSDEVKEYIERTSNLQLGIFEFTTIYYPKLGTVYTCKVLDLQSGKTIFYYEKKMKSVLSFRTGCIQVKKVSKIIENSYLN